MTKVLDFSTPGSGTVVLLTATVTLRCYLIPSLLSRDHKSIAVLVKSKPVHIGCDVNYDLLPSPEGTKCFLAPFTTDLFGLILEQTRETPKCFRRLGTFHLGDNYEVNISERTPKNRNRFDPFWKAGFDYSHSVGGDKYDDILQYTLDSQGMRYGRHDGVVQHVVTII
jgi:hypothetical protein